MNNFDRNTRTLIVSFLVAIFALIPLRFVEAGTQQSLIGDAQVLGEVISIPEEVSMEVEAKLEAPYDELENCVSQAEFEEVKNEVEIQVQDPEINQERVEELLDWLIESEANVCSN